MYTLELAKVFGVIKAKLGPLTLFKGLSNSIVHSKVGCFINLQSFTFHFISNMKMFNIYILVISKQTKIFPNLGSTTPLSSVSQGASAHSLILS